MMRAATSVEPITAALQNAFGMQLGTTRSWYGVACFDVPITSDLLAKIQECVPSRTEGRLKKRTVYVGALEQVSPTSVIVTFAESGNTAHGLASAFTTAIARMVADLASAQTTRPESRSEARKRLVAEGDAALADLNAALNDLLAPYRARGDR